MRISLVIAALATGLLSIGPASADEPAAGFGRRPVYAPPSQGPRYAPAPRRYGYGYGYGGPRHRHYGHPPAQMVAAPGPMPTFFEGMSAAIDNMVDSRVHVSLYREAYIGRGLLYNTPPTLDRPGPGFGPVLSARY